MKLPQKGQNNNKQSSQKSKPQISNSKPIAKPTSQKPAKKPLSIIDDIFKAKKQQKQQQIAAQHQSKTQQEIKKEKKQKKIAKELKIRMRLQQKLRKLNDGQIPSTKKTEGGLKIYTEEDLNIGKGGNTKNCPFDCNCCF